MGEGVAEADRAATVVPEVEHEVGQAGVGGVEQRHLDRPTELAGVVGREGRDLEDAGLVAKLEKRHHCTKGTTTRIGNAKKGGGGC